MEEIGDGGIGEGGMRIRGKEEFLREAKEFLGVIICV